MIENHIALPIRPSPLDDLQPEREEMCIICDREGCLVSDGWYTDTDVDTDEDGAYLYGRGDQLIDAFDTPSGWVCSNRCRSQEMYNRADDFNQKALKKVRDACYVLAEYGKYARAVVNKDMNGFTGDYLIDEANDFLEAIADDGKNMPDWCEK